MNDSATLSAVDRLNSWVRSASAREWFSPPRRAVYDWKHYLLRQAVTEGLGEHRAIKTRVKCRDCGGTGKYVDSMGYKFDHCRACGNGGTVTLTFLESAFQGVKWHTPWLHAPHVEGVTWESAVFVLGCDWAPNQPGIDMETVEVAACLNVAETQIPKSALGWTNTDYGYFDHSRYTLFVGRGPMVCGICQRPASEPDERGCRDGNYFHCVRGVVDFLSWGCRSCDKEYAHQLQYSDEKRRYIPSGSNGRSIFDELPVPPGACEHPEIQQWIARHEALAESPKGTR